MASMSKRSHKHELAVGFKKVRVTILASEWGSSKGGLSTISRELAIQLAKLPEVDITVFLLRCSEEDKNQALLSNVKIVEATRHPGFDELDWLSFPPEHLQIDVIVGHGVKLGHQAQVIKKSKKCKWVQVVHTDPEELGMFKSYSKPISKGQEKHRIEVELCEMADLVVGIGPKLSEAFRSYLRSCHKDQNVVDFTPGIFDEFKSVKQSPEERKHCSILVFGRGDNEDFELKGFDIAARAVAPLRDTRLVFVGALDGKHEEIKEKLTGCGVPARNLRVRGFVQSREDLKRLFLEVDLVLMPSRTEGFGLTGLEALSAGLPVLVSSNSGFGEALNKVPFGSSFVIDSEDPEVWTAEMKRVWGKDRQGRLEEAEMLRTSYERKYSWANQSRDLLGKMIRLLNGNSDINTSLQERFAGAGLGEVSLQDARTVKPLKLDDQRRVQEGLTEVEAERQNSAVHQISYEIANCEGDIAFFAGRCHKDTRQWLFDDFDKWFSDPGDSRAYVLLGDAGVGKSVIAGALVQRMKKSGCLGAAYFCRHYDGTRNDPRNLLGTIACQLCNCNSQYSKIMGGEDGVRIMLANSNLGVQELCTKLLEEPLSKCKPFQPRKLVVIDALDETEHKSRKDFIFLIKERFPRLPEWLVFFITSRPENMLQSKLAKYNPCTRICAGNGEQRTLYYQQHEQDIQRFLEDSVDFSRLPCSVQDVTRRCNGLFLYAFYIKQELNGSLHSGKIDLPMGIEDFFETNLKRVYDKVGADLYGKLLGCIMNAPSPLPVSFVSFVLHRENSSLNKQKVMDAVSQFVVMQKRVSFLHSLIPAWLTTKKKAQELYIDPKEAGGYLTEIVKEILSAFVSEPRLKLDHVERDLQSFALHFAVHLLCQQAEEDSLEFVFKCLTSYRFLEERISSGRFGIYYLLKDFQRATSCLAVEQRERQNTILQEISLAIESDVHVLVENPHLLPSCIRNASDIVQENVLIPQVSLPWFEWNDFDRLAANILSECNCFATASDKETVVGAKGRSLFFFNASMLQIVSGPFEISEDTIAKINHLEFSSDGKFVFFGRLDKWFSVERGCVEDFPQFVGNGLNYQWGLITPNGHCIVVKTNVLLFPSMCKRGCCLKELLALWAGKEIENSGQEEMTCSFGELSKGLAGIDVIGRHARYLMEYLGVDPCSFQNHVMFVPEDSSCYCCCKLKELTESSPELSLSTVRQIIIDLYPRLFRYQVWNLQSGQPLLHDVFNQGAQLNPFAYFCHVAGAFDKRGTATMCSGVVEAVSVCNLAIVSAVYYLLKLELELCFNNQLPNILEPDWKLIISRENERYTMYVRTFLLNLETEVSIIFSLCYASPLIIRCRQHLTHLIILIQLRIDNPMKFHDVWVKLLDALSEASALRHCQFPAWFHGPFCNSLKSDLITHVPKGFLDLFGKDVSFCLSPEKKWIILCMKNGLDNVDLLLTRIQEDSSRNENSTKNEHHITRITRFTFTNDDLFALYSTSRNSLYALCLQTGKVFVSVSGCNFVLFKKEKQVGYFFRRDVEKRLVFLKNLFSPFQFLQWLHEQKPGLEKSVTPMFSLSRTVRCISYSDSFVALWNFKDDYDSAFPFTSNFPLPFSPPAQASYETRKYVYSPDTELIALQQQNKITLHFVAEPNKRPCTIFETECGIMDAGLKFSADSSLLLVCIQDDFKGPLFYVWDVKRESMSESFKSPGPPTVDCFCLSPDLNNLILCGGRYEIEIWDFKKQPRCLLKKMEVEGFYNPVKFSQCNVSLDNELLVCCIGNLIYVYNLPVSHSKIHSSRRILRGHVGKIEFCRFLEVNRYLITYAIDGMVFVWDVTESKAIGFIRIAQGQEKVTSMTVSPEEDRVVCFLSSNRVCVIHLYKLESAMGNKFSMELTKSKEKATESRIHLAERIPSTSNIPTAFAEDYKSEASSSSDSEESFLTDNDFYEFSESD